MTDKEEKKCSKCGKTYPLTAEYFAKNQSTNTGGDKYFRPECKECYKKGTKGKYIAYTKAGKPTRPELGTSCDNCGRTDRKLVFDHCHKTLTQRGWLCDNCNRSMGMLGDDVESLMSSTVYIIKSTPMSEEEAKAKFAEVLEKK